MQTYSFGCCPDEVIRKACNHNCPHGYELHTYYNQAEWAIIADCVNEGIDSHLEAITARSKFNNGMCIIHPDELHVLLRRLYENGDSAAWCLRSDILQTLEIEEV